MPLQQLDLLEEYRSDRHNLIADFYLPCLDWYPIGASGKKNRSL
ncbi:hypothetical protein ACQY1Y_13190 [Microcystis ichthyoblabe FBCC-A1114]